MNSKNKRRPVVSIDEKRIQAFIAGESPSGEEKKEETKEVIPAGEPEGESQESVPLKKKRKSTSYKELFFDKSLIRDKRHTTIVLDSQLVERLNRFLSLAGNGISFSSFVNNILHHHIEQYKSQINEIYNDYNGELF